MNKQANEVLASNTFAFRGILGECLEVYCEGDEVLAVRAYFNGHGSLTFTLREPLGEFHLRGKAPLGCATRLSGGRATTGGLLNLVDEFEAKDLGEGRWELAGLWDAHDFAKDCIAAGFKTERKHGSKIVKVSK